MAKITLVIPVYNVEPYLRECLDSVLNQTFANWEAVCVNDGSTDGSVAILEEYALKDNRFIILSQPNGGLSAARNAGMKVAKGDYILFLDSDDWLETNTLQTLVQNMEDEDMLCFSGRRFIEKTGDYCPTDQLNEKTYPTGMAYYEENALQQRDFAFVCVVLRLYRRQFLLENALHFKEGIYHEDNLFTPLACYHAQKVKVLNACLYDYRVRANSIMTTVDAKHRLDLMTIANELAGFFVTKQGFDKTVVYRIITHHYQVAFLNASKEERKNLKRLCDWYLYHKVSRMKLRHRLRYIRNRFCYWDTNERKNHCYQRDSIHLCG